MRAKDNVFDSVRKEMTAGGWAGKCNHNFYRKKWRAKWLNIQKVS